MPDTLTSRRGTRDIPLQTRFAPVAGADTKARTVDVVWTTGARVRRFDWEMGRYYQEELSLAPGAIQMERLNSGRAPFLDSHGAYDVRNVLGVVERAWVAGGEHLARVRFSDREDVEPVYADVVAGILRNVSVGYRIERMEMIPPEQGDGDWVYRALLWTPYEISLVPLAADPGAATRGLTGERADGRPTFPCEFIEEEQRSMPNETPEAVRAERERVNEINRRVREAGFEQEFADGLVNGNATIEASCRAIVDELAKRKPAPPICGIRSEPNATPGSIVGDMASMVVARYGGPAPSEAARRFSAYRLTDMASDLLELRGISARGLSRDQLVERAMHSTSDFPSLLENVTNKVLRLGYEAAPAGTKVAARQVLARDFKPLSRVQFGESPALQKVLEGGEYKRGKVLDSKETYSVATYGRIIGISRQAIVNDDLQAFARVARQMGWAAAEFESGQITGLLTANAAMADGGALFNVTTPAVGGTGHGNLGTGTGSALSATGLAAGTKAMRLQKGLDASTPINVAPRYLIVPAALEYTALQLVTAITPTTINDVNVYAGKLEVVVDPRLDASSTTAWYLVADPAAVDGLEYAYLEDSPGLQLMMREDFDTAGIEWRASLDFGCAPVEWRALYKGAGA